MATLKSTREAPTRLFENYVASIKKIPGAVSPPGGMSDSLFREYLIDVEDFSTWDPAESKVDVPLGFNYKINDVIFDKFCVTPYGWLLLLPADESFTGGSSTWWEAYDSYMEAGSTSYAAEDIRVKQWKKDGIMLLPFMRDQKPAPKTLKILESTGDWSSLLTAEEIEAYDQGKSSVPWPIDDTDRGVRFSQYNDANYGRCCSVRWTTFTKSGQVSYRYKFEAVIFENGRIEFRYWPVILFPPTGIFLPTVTPSAAGIFWQTGKSRGFRDITPLFDYKKNERKLLEMGGYQPYEEGAPSWVDTFLATTTIYGCPRGLQINPILNANTVSSVVVFSPPVNTGKFIKKSIQNINNNKDVVRSPGLFDDRKTIAFETANSSMLYMPSTLPTRLEGDTGETDVSYRQHLYTTRSDVLHQVAKKTQTNTQENNISVLGSTRKAAIDSLVNQVDLEAKSREHSDRSFNESSQLYEVTDPPNEFYASGSSFSQFGDGFTTPLKSKTKFHLTLPITKPTTMPALTSSIYYYDSDKQAWRMVNPNGNRNILPIRIEQTSFASPGLGEETDEQYYYKVTETNRGFDAVGRKCSLSSDLLTHTINDSTFQTGPYIGAIANVNERQNAQGALPLSGSSVLNNDVLSVKYPSSLWENEREFPKEQQQISLPIDYPFLVEKIVVEFPFYAEESWFDDKTTVTRGFGSGRAGAARYFWSTPCGPIDFGGPGVTFSLICPRRNGSLTRMDLIASGTLTHSNDIKKVEMVALEETLGSAAGSECSSWMIRQVGFESFSNPTVVIQEALDPASGKRFFDGKIKMEILPAVAGGITYGFNHRAYACDGDDGSQGDNFSGDWALLNDYKAERLLSTDYDFGIVAENFWDFDTQNPFGLPAGSIKLIAFLLQSNLYNNWLDQKNAADTIITSPFDLYYQSFGSPRVHIMNVAALPRGSTGIDFNGNSILGGSIARIEEKTIRNPFFVNETLPSEYTNKFSAAIGGAKNFQFEAVASWSTFTSKVSPYLLLPGDKLTLAMSKTRPVVNSFERTPFAIAQEVYGYGGTSGEIYFSGSHNTVILSTGSIEITLYGSYVREGEEYNP